MLGTMNYLTTPDDELKSSLQGYSVLSSILVNTRQDCRGKDQCPLKSLGSRRLIPVTASKASY